MFRSRQHRAIWLCAILIGQCFTVLTLSQPVDAVDLEGMIKEGLKNQLPRAVQQQPIKVGPKAQKLDDLIQRQDLPYSFPPMIPLQGITIAGLGQKAIMSLGENYFVVRSNTNATMMSELYKQNKQAGKANFVTVDCILHPYMAFCNRISAETIKRHLLPLMKQLLLAMLKVAMADYKQADDADVRTDIECNIAFLSLALKLIDSSFSIPLLGRVPQLVQADYDNVAFAKAGKSLIFDRNEDFSAYRPTGWYRSSPELITFFRVKTWLSRLSYPINDVTFEADGIRANNFRRSILLYRCLDLARIEGKPAYEYWTRLVKAMFVLGSQVENWQERNLYAHDYKSVFKPNTNAATGAPTDLKFSLQALSEPLYRTKLLLAVRKQKPLSLGSTSIFDLEESQKGKEQVAAFRFIPTIGSPEDPWMNYAAGLYPKQGLTTTIFPVALMDLNAWGAPQASNFILDSAWAMEEVAAKTVTELKRWVLRRAVAGQVQPVDCRLWNLLSSSWRLLPDGIQTALRVEMWGNRRLETAFSGWLDSKVSIAPLHYAGSKSTQDLESSSSDADSSSTEENLDEAMANVPAVVPSKVALPATSKNAAGTTTPSGASNQSTLGQKVLHGRNTTPNPAVSPPTTATTGASATTTGPAKPAVKPHLQRRAARGHFLDPVPDFYNKLILDAQRIEKEMLGLGFVLEPNLKRGLDDYTRLFQRFAKIAKDELEGRPLAQADLNLLGNIDVILEKIDVPLPAVLPVTPQAKFDGTDNDNETGFTMALGRPGLLYIILMNKVTKEWTLARGAVYTYYEVHGTSMNEEALLNRIDKGTISPPYWTERFDFVQADKKQ